jgi:glycosyltransferase involved in cell wall biosynthesis
MKAIGKKSRMVAASVAEAIHVGPHPLTVGGTQSVIRTIAEESIGADAIAVAPTWEGFDQRRNANLVRRAAGNLLRARKGAIVHVHLSNGGAYLRDGPLIALARSRGLRPVVTIHGYDFPEFVARQRPFVRSILASARGVLCLSEEALAAVEGLGIGAKARCLDNPVTLEREPTPAGETEPVALFAGAVGHRKGVDVLEAAWRLLLQRGVTGRCRIVGPSEDYEPGSLERLSVEGPVDPRLVRKLISESRVVVLPSRSEGMPMVLTEALACGRPFVSTPVGGTASLAPCEGMIVPVGEPPALADALARFLGDSSAASQVGARCYEYCAETRGPSVIDRQLRDFYRAL